MKEAPKFIVILVFGLAAGFFIRPMITDQKKPGTSPSVSLSQGKDESCTLGGAESKEGLLFELENKGYTLSDFSDKFKQQYFKITDEAYHKKVALIDKMALTIWLAKSKGQAIDLKSPPELDRLLPPKEVSDAEINKFFKENKKRLPPNAKLETYKPQIKMFLAGQGLQKVYLEKLNKVKKEGKYKNALSKPIAPKVVINTEGYPYLGAKNAKFTLIEASDYTCGHCKNIHPEVKELIKKHGDKIKLVQMNFSLQPQGLSGKLILGAYCAQKQSIDKFWSYHNLTFEKNFETKDYNPSHIAKLAKLDIKKFNACLNDKASKDFVMKTNEALISAGVNSTPSFFLNNKKVHLHGKNLQLAVEEAMKL
jgi:protein-disulfide isomerase